VKDPDQVTFLLYLINRLLQIHLFHLSEFLLELDLQIVHLLHIMHCNLRGESAVDMRGGGGVSPRVALAVERLVEQGWGWLGGVGVSEHLVKGVLVGGHDCAFRLAFLRVQVLVRVLLKTRHPASVPVALVVAH